MVEIAKLQLIEQSNTYHITIPAVFITELKLGKGDHLTIKQIGNRLELEKINI